MERTCILIKPDAVCKDLTGVIVDRFSKSGLKLRAAKMMRLTPRQAEDLYAQHKGQPFYEPLIRFMTSAPIVASVWEGDGAIQKARAVMGSTNSPEAAVGTIRREFGTNNRYNVVHGSDSSSSAEREIRFFFQPEELYKYQVDDWKV